MADILALGEALIDFTSISSDSEGYPTMAAHPGGAPANFLAALTKFGMSTALYAKLGDDTFGRLLEKTLSNAGIGTEGLIFDKDVFTTLAFVTLDPSGDRSFAFSRKPGADTCLQFSELDLSLLEECKVFHFGTLSLTDEPARSTTQKTVELAKNKGKLITFDPNLRVPLWKDLDEAKRQILWGLGKADIVKISLEEIEFLFGLDEKTGSDKILNDFGAKLVFATLGKEGCYYNNGQAKGYVANYNDVKTVDTTGAGDIFGGSAIYGVLTSNTEPQNLTASQLNDIVSFACASASLSTENYGGISSVANKEKIIELVNDIN